MTDPALYKAQAERCRRLGAMAEEREAKMLNDLADEYEAKARAVLDGKRGGSPHLPPSVVAF